MRKPTEPSRKEELQEVIDYLIENGVSEFNTQMLLNTNMPYLGGNRSMMNEVRDGNWSKVWDAAELYVSGDMW